MERRDKVEKKLNEITQINEDDAIDSLSLSSLEKILLDVILENSSFIEARKNLRKNQSELKDRVVEERKILLSIWIISTLTAFFGVTILRCYSKFEMSKDFAIAIICLLISTAITIAVIFWTKRGIIRPD